MITFLLIRHALTDFTAEGKLSGWLPELHLSEEGAAQAKTLAERFREIRIDAICSSPLERCIETAQPIAEIFGLKIKTSEALGELRFGDWTGKSFDELENEPEWRNFNSFRSSARIPGGESMFEAQLRIISELENLRRIHDGETVAVVSHLDLIRAAIAHYAGIHLDLFQRIEISPASVSVVNLGEDFVRIAAINDTGRIIA